MRYAILPIVQAAPSQDPMCPGCIDEILPVRHHSDFMPRDFAVIKPTLASGFDHRQLARRDGPVAAVTA